MCVTRSPQPCSWAVLRECCSGDDGLGWTGRRRQRGKIETGALAELCAQPWVYSKD